MKPIDMAFATVIVTYGGEKRINGLIKTIESVIIGGSKKIYLVNNGCTYDINLIIEKHFAEAKIEIINFKENMGSSIGFCAGLKRSLNDIALGSNEYILVLDDDVILDENFIKSFLSVENDIIDNKHVWSLIRKGRECISNDNKDRNIKYYNNSIAAFSIYRNKSKVYCKRANKKISEPIFVPWAGLYIRKGDLLNIKLPDNDYFVYEDDADFSLNIRESGYKIYKNDQLILRESSSSWFESNGNQESGYKLYYDIDVSPGRFLYKIRNNVFLIKNRLLTNPVLFYLNIFLYILLGFIRYGSFTKNGFCRLNMLINAVLAGLNSRLGKNEKWKL